MESNTYTAFEFYRQCHDATLYINITFMIQILLEHRYQKQLDLYHKLISDLLLL
jgi:hypothetical protein